MVAIAFIFFHVVGKIYRPVLKHRLSINCYENERDMYVGRFRIKILALFSQVIVVYRNLDYFAKCLACMEKYIHAHIIRFGYFHLFSIPSNFYFIFNYLSQFRKFINFIVREIFFFFSFFHSRLYNFLFDDCFETRWLIKNECGSLE